jgi:alkanesulfonate monooxygenase SsuD/methylene tetrahydromethanopterin reductase-like flavin-dependent oxidoreductase (luciferase family)
MELGIIADLRNPPRPDWHRPWEAHYGGFLDLMAGLEQIGFSQVVFPEHHFERDGYIPNPIPMMTAVAMRCPTMLVGSDLFVLPNWHPVRLAEDVAMVDILSGGRVLFKAGAGGAYPGIMGGIGYPASSQLGRNSEALDIIRRCWTEDEFDHDGRHWQLRGVRATPRPVQQPHPPIFLPAMRAKAMERNAREGFGANMPGSLTTVADPAFWKQWHAKWDAALERHGRTADECPVSLFLNVFCTEDPERAWARFREGMLHVEHQYALLRGEQPAPATPEDLPNWQQVFFTPDDLVGYLTDMLGGAAPDHLLLWDNRPGMTWDDSYEMHQLFVDRVWPRIRDLR